MAELTLSIYQVDAFASGPFRGNPAAVCVMDSWIADDLMQAIAAENNLPETAFVVATNDAYEIRWFTPTCEVELCGHATLASGYVLLEVLQSAQDRIRFSSRSGPLQVSRTASGLLELDLPMQTMLPCAPVDALERGLGVAIREIYEGPNHLVVLESQSEVANITPDMEALASVPDRACIVTAPGESADTDFVSRFFAPRFGIPEDPVTGSAHCMLVPYWAGRLGRSLMQARQLSARGGELICRLDGDRVFLAGEAYCYLRGAITVPIVS